MLAVSKKAGQSLKPAQQAKFRAEADKVFDANAAKYNAQEQEAIEFFKKEGKQVYAPDQNAFRTFAQKQLSRQIRQRMAEGRDREDQRGQVRVGSNRGIGPVISIPPGPVLAGCQMTAGLFSHFAAKSATLPERPNE